MIRGTSRAIINSSVLLSDPAQWASLSFHGIGMFTMAARGTWFSIQDLFYYLSGAFALGLIEGLLIYYYRLLGMGQPYGYALFLGCLYIIAISGPVYLLHLFIPSGWERSLQGWFCGLVYFLLGVRFYRFMVGQLARFHVEVSILGVFVIICLIAWYFPLSKRFRWWGWVPAVVILVVLGGLVFSAVPHPDMQLEVNGEKPNIIWFTADALRADHLSQYGYEKNTFHQFDRWKDDFVQFQRSYAQSSWTAPSVTSYFTGLYPLQHGKSRGNVMHKNIVTLPQILDRAGYTNHAMSSSRLMSPSWGFGRGFDQFHTVISPFKETSLLDVLEKLFGIETASQIFFHLNVFSDSVKPTGRSLDLLNNSFNQWSNEMPDSPFFLYLHAMDPHAPYDPAPKYYPDAEADLEETPFMNDNRRRPEGKPAEDVIADIVRRYDGEINHVGAVFDEVLSRLKKRGLYEDSLIIFTSEHGEEFYEHGKLGHLRHLHQEVVRIPLFIKLPDNELGGRVVQPYAENVDLPTTILELLDARINLTYPMEGDALFKEGPSLNKNTSDPILEFIKSGQQNFHAARVTGDRKLYYRSKSDTEGRMTLHQLTEDGFHSERLSERPPRTMVEPFLSEIRRHQSFRYSPSPVSESQREILRGLGYIE